MQGRIIAAVIVVAIAIIGIGIFVSSGLLILPGPATPTVSTTSTTQITSIDTTTTPAQANQSNQGSLTGMRTTGVPENVALNSCHAGNEFFSASPLNLSNITYILPIGNMEPQGHTAPSDHIYLMLTHDSQLLPIVTSVYAPGNMTVYKIAETHYVDSGVNSYDYAIYFAPCANITGVFYHLPSLSTKLLSNYTQPPAWAGPMDSCTNYTEGNGASPVSVQYCYKYIDVPVKAGEYIGTAGERYFQGSRALDMGLFDYRSTPILFVNFSRYEFLVEDFYDVCPLDYFSPSLRSTLYSYLGYENERRTVPPICGTIAQDVPGTVQGTWYLSGKQFAPPALALVHDNINGTEPIFSVGTMIGALNNATYTFSESGSGLINRNFANVTLGSIYCYQGLSEKYPTAGVAVHGSLLVQLTDANTMMVEYQSGSCSSSENFTANRIYFYR